jgi:hypothetical protein
MIIASIIGRTRTTLSLLVLMVFVGLAARSALPIANDPHVDLAAFLRRGEPRRYLSGGCRAITRSADGD